MNYLLKHPRIFLRIGCPSICESFVEFPEKLGILNIFVPNNFAFVILGFHD